MHLVSDISQSLSIKPALLGYHQNKTKKKIPVRLHTVSLLLWRNKKQACELTELKKDAKVHLNSLRHKCVEKYVKSLTIIRKWKGIMGSHKVQIFYSSSMISTVTRPQFVELPLHSAAGGTQFWELAPLFRAVPRRTSFPQGCFSSSICTARGSDEVM